ncbi:hypothetical protein BKA70DRAFT_1129825 [Coprinopsis sp. MPI-PUGE-AT-0042]|nr:hypothetical protein BKA70DRAFT_1129825 [Coprinopsis sp. MPI-PUGE-AT-0042]
MDIQDLPEEILTKIFEEGVHKLGAIAFLHPICLVCKRWHAVVSATPRLWGIIDVARGWTAPRIRRHMARCKSAPLTIFIQSEWAERSKKQQKNRHERWKVVTELLNLSENWVSAVLPLETFRRRKWPEGYPNLELLTLVGDRPGTFQDPPTSPQGLADVHPSPRLAKLREVDLSYVHPGWIELFVSPSIRSIRYLADPLARADGPPPIFSTLDWLSKLPNLQELNIFDSIYYPPSSTPEILQIQRRSRVELPRLESLHLTGRDHPVLLLEAHAIRTPSLLTLSIQRFGRLREPSMDPTLGLGAVFLHWCNDRTDQFLPVHLHTLKPENCLIPDDVPSLVHLLAHLPDLVRLSVGSIQTPSDLLEGLSPRVDPTNAHMVLDALCKPVVTTGKDSSVDEGEPQVWLCPSLLLLDLSVPDMQIQDFVELAQVRGVRSRVHLLYAGAPKTLRRLRGPLCTDGQPGALAKLKQLVDDFECGCLSCAMDHCLML